MKIAVCHTKSGAVARNVYGAFIRGLSVHGDTHLSIYKGENVLERLKKCDLSMQMFESKIRSKQFILRNGKKVLRSCNIQNLPSFCLQIREYQKEISKKRLVIETGFFKNHHCKDLPIRQRYFQIGYGGVKGSAKCHNADSPGDRWSNLDIQVKPWRKTGSHVLIMGQNIYGVSASHTDLLKWWEEIIPKIRKLTDKPIKMRPHPTQKNFPTCKITKRTDMKTDLEDCWCVVARSTNAAIDAIINGIPVITPDKICMAYDVSSHSIEDINNPATPDRTQWLNDLAYAQWSVEEIEAGAPWGKLRELANA